MAKKKKLKALAKGKPSTKKVSNSHLYTEDLPKGLQIVVGEPLKPGTQKYQERQDLFEAKRLAEEELAKGEAEKPLVSSMAAAFNKANAA